MLVMGLTGSIATGKTTISNWMKELGLPVFEADAVVHQLFNNDQDFINKIGKIWPHCIQQGKVDRGELRKEVISDKTTLKKLEKITHPAVFRKREEFVEQQKKAGSSVVFLDIPLLYEVSNLEGIDGVLVVECSLDTQIKRARDRGTPPDLLMYLLSLQMPLPEKVKKADFVLNTDASLAKTRELLLQRLHEIEDHFSVKFLKDEHA